MLSSNVTRLHAAAALAATCALFGCTNLTGAEDVDGDKSDSKTKVVEVAPSPAPKEMRCAYPTTGNVGVSVGQMLSSSMSWQGVAPGGDVNDTVNVPEFSDCLGMTWDAVMFDTSQFG